MFKGIRTTAIVAGLIKIGKTAIDTASALEEVQNVVDVSFGASAGEINLFAKNAIKQFGLSELSAKKMASAFMAMANGMDINVASGKQMATTLMQQKPHSILFSLVRQKALKSLVSS